MGHARKYTDTCRIFVCEMQLFLKKAMVSQTLVKKITN
jgi:hypothetical protein